MSLVWMRRLSSMRSGEGCEVLTNVLYALSRLALGRASLTSTILERMHGERARAVPADCSASAGVGADRDLGCPVAAAASRSA